MDKMREEFEAWHIEQCKADGMDWRDLSSELERDGDEYVYAGAHYAWRGWKASRAALCVDIPPGIGEKQFMNIISQFVSCGIDWS